MLATLAFVAFAVLGMAALPWSYEAHVGDYGRRIRFKARIGGAMPGTGNIGWTVTPVLAFEARCNGVAVPGTITGDFHIVSLSTCEYDWEPLDSGVLNASGTWEFTLIVMHGAESYRCDPVTKSVGPSLGGSPGSIASAHGTAAQVQAQLVGLAALATEDAPGILRFPPGTFTFTEPVVIQGLSNLVIELHEQTVIVGDFDGTAEDPLNAIFRCIPIEVGSPTALAADVFCGATSLTVDSTSGFTVGTYFRSTAIPGTPGVDQLRWVEVHRVLTLPGGLTVNLAWPVEIGNIASVRHLDGEAVQRITPCQNITFRGGGLITGSGSVIACAILFRSVLGCTQDGIRFEGFARAAVRFDGGSRDLRSRDGYSLGENNCLVSVESSHFGEVSGWTSKLNPTLRCHASGIVRYAIELRTMHVGIHVHSNRIQCMDSGGIRFGGGRDPIIGPNHWHDLGSDRLMTDGASVHEMTQSTAPDGVAVNGGFGTTTYGLDEFSYGAQVDEQVCSNIYLPGNTLAVSLHDHRAGCSRGGSIINMRANPSSPRYAGLYINDANQFQIENWTIRGCGPAVKTENQPSCTVRKLQLDAQGISANGTHAFQFDHQGTAMLVFRGVLMGNYSIWFIFGVTIPQDSVEIYDLEADGFYCKHAIIAYNATGVSFSRGDVVHMDDGADLGGTAGRRQIFTPAGPGPNNWIVVLGNSDTKTGQMFVATPSAGITSVMASGTVKVGDKMVADTNRRAVVDGAADKDNLIGYALDARSGVGSSLIRVSPSAS